MRSATHARYPQAGGQGNDGFAFAGRWRRFGNIVKFWSLIVVVAWQLAAASASAERINHAGRILGQLPVVTNAVLFNTPEADAIVSAMQVFPTTSAWNEDISHRPVLSNSEAMITQIIADLRSDRRMLIAFKEMNYALVTDNQAVSVMRFVTYPGESDLNGGISPNGLYPIPFNLPVETWPAETGGLTLEQWQQNDDGSDRHSIIVQPGMGNLFETWRTVRTPTNWIAANGAKFNLNTNGLRPDGWTSGDAAGLPMFPALVRFDECERGAIEHALRIVVRRSRYGNYIYPATHYASAATNTSTNLPAMGQRVRLKSSFAIPANWTKQEKAVLVALKKYGAMVADNGNFFSISVTPDNRWPVECFDNLRNVAITNFEVIQTTGPTEGPRSSGAPVAHAGPDRIVPLSTMLQGFVSFSNPATTNQWKLYSGPGNVAFGNASLTNTTATFSAPGVYTLMLSAGDGVHAIVYDAVVLTVASSIALTISPADANVNLSWVGGSPPFVVERANAVSPSIWSGVVTTSQQSIMLPRTNGTGFFRVRGS